MWKQELADRKERFADVFSLSKDVISNATLLYAIGQKNIYIENFKSILAYSNNEIVIKGSDGKVTVSGKNLCIDYYSTQDMKITGQIADVAFIKGV